MTDGFTQQVEEARTPEENNTIISDNGDILHGLFLEKPAGKFIPWLSHCLLLNQSTVSWLYKTFQSRSKEKQETL